MNNIVKLHTVDIDSEKLPIVEMLRETLKRVIDGEILAVAVCCISESGVSTSWEMKADKGHAHLLVSGATRLIYDLNASAIENENEKEDF